MANKRRIQVRSKPASDAGQVAGRMEHGNEPIAQSAAPVPSAAPASTDAPALPSGTERVMVELTPRELALIQIIRRVRYGRITRISVRNGEPYAIDYRPDPEGLPISQQVDLGDPEILKRLLRQLCQFDTSSDG